LDVEELQEVGQIYPIKKEKSNHLGRAVSDRLLLEGNVRNN